MTSHTLALGAAIVAYTATAGHLDARDPRSGATEASMFYVAYTVAGAPAARPLVFFYNGGPGSASVWLHLGSFAPRRVVTHAPSLAVPLPFELVDNDESLIDVADLVFVDAVGSGYSEAVAPYANSSFWGVDKDAALMRDFIARYVAVYQRAASPTYLFGESYGTTRSAVLAELMLAAGMRLDGVVLQSSVLDYNTNCDAFAPGAVSCAGYLPSYGEVGAWHALSHPVPADADAYADTMRSFTTLDLRACGRCLHRHAPAVAGGAGRRAERSDRRSGVALGRQLRSRSARVPQPRPPRPADGPLRRAHRRSFGERARCFRRSVVVADHGSVRRRGAAAVRR